jgi:hypothetical protein
MTESKAFYTSEEVFGEPFERDILNFEDNIKVEILSLEKYYRYEGQVDFWVVGKILNGIYSGTRMPIRIIRTASVNVSNNYFDICYYFKAFMYAPIIDLMDVA